MLAQGDKAHGEGAVNVITLGQTVRCRCAGLAHIKTIRDDVSLIFSVTVFVLDSVMTPSPYSPFTIEPVNASISTTARPVSACLGSLMHVDDGHHAHGEPSLADQVSKVECR